MNAPRRAPARREASPRHGIHFYLALAGIIGGVMVFVVTLWAYYDEVPTATALAFATSCVEATVLFFTFLWGFALTMSGTLPRSRLTYLLIHGALGCLSPLLYTLIISAELQDTLARPVSDLDLVLAFASIWVLATQFISGLVTRFGRPWGN